MALWEWLLDLADRDMLWIVHAFGVVCFTLVAAIVASKVVVRIARKAEDTNGLWFALVLKALQPPLKWLIWLVGLSWASYLTHRGAQLELLEAVHLVRQVGVFVLVAWFLVRLVGLGEQEFLAPHRGEPSDPTTVLAVGKLLRIAVVITAGLVLLQTLGYSVAGVLAFGGVGGLAVGFAARDLLANFFGGLMIYMDRPFAVGEWIRSPDREIEGTVEDIGWRLTRIRTFDRRPLYVPNSIFTQVAVENPSRMEHRRIYETIGIRYADADKMAPIVADVKAMLLEHPDIETEERVLIVNFVTFNTSSLDFFVYTFTKTRDWVDYHEIKQDVLLRIMAIIQGHGASVAFPTSTLHLADPITLAREASAPAVSHEGKDFPRG
ncbi:mechanosensitive ion channel family protein [Marinimicrobium sp. ABcell2]|uniref:mechanosensitive ion channel family protein n=1 Tax=Marinimicrobium sp. ABcell2 TaxID=3069751 RepID=UPI0027B84CC4|nr:mechanosensitive ion channel family protein [Marinimicrobium sp. ABcell2]MDQ2075583.1 mechanosensitive ion channel family protein [Marinimicrobium sp. ABcell2]